MIINDNITINFDIYYDGNIYMLYKWFIDNLCTIENMYDRFGDIEIKIESYEDFKLAKRLCTIYEYYRMEYKKLDKFGYCDCKDDVYFYASTEGSCLYEWLHRAMEKYMYLGDIKAD